MLSLPLYLQLNFPIFQTFHPANRTFWEGEVFKTSKSPVPHISNRHLTHFPGHFAEHPLEDIIEKIACQFTARHIRGRPRPPFWYLGFPLYVCDSRYNDRDRVFVRIKNWNSCVPEEVRKKEEFMPIYPFEKTVMPGRFPSPFVGKSAGAGGKRWPGGILADAGGGAGAEKGVKEEEKVGGVAEGVRKRPRRAAAGGGGEGGTSKGAVNSAALSSLATAYQPSSLSQQVQVPRPPGPDRSVLTAAGGLAVLGQGAHVEKLPPETGTWVSYGVLVCD
jgi:chromatin structure-remodeling complex subunit RSC1/2